MRYRRLGQTDMQVSAIALGTMTWGEQNSQAQAHEQMDKALASGVNFFDVAEIYPVPVQEKTSGQTECYIGNWFSQRKNRGQVILASKIAGRSSGLAWLRGEKPYLSPDHINRAVEASLKRLQTDYIDLYQLHWPDRSTNFFGQLEYKHAENDETIAIEDQLQALDKLVQDGKIRAIGLSNETPWGLSRFLHLADKNGWARVASIQNPYNLLNRSFEIGLAEIAIREQSGLLAYSPLGFGVLSGKYLEGQKPDGSRLTLFGDIFPRYMSDKAQVATKRYVDLALEHGLNPAQMALAFVTSRPFVTSNIIGATTLAQLEVNISSNDVALSDAVLDGIETIHRDITNPAP